ncbi:prephenate dehydrogenase [Acidobacteriota bacterium]
MVKKLHEMTFTIIGIGQIGGSFALSLKKNQIGKKIIGVDKKNVTQKLSGTTAFDSLTTELDPSIQEADFIFLSVPVLSILSLLPQIIPKMKPGALLLDSGSTKRSIVTLMAKYPDKILIGGHPIAGKEKPGFDSASSILLEEKLFALVFPTKESQQGKQTVLTILKKMSIIPFEISEEKHDFIVSLTSHLPYVLSLTLSFLADEFFSKDVLFKKFVSSGFLGNSRLSFTQKEMGKGILMSNTHHITQLIDEYIDRLGYLKGLIKQEDEKKLGIFLDRINRFQVDLE